MLWSRFILIFMLALVSARPSPELSLEDIEKELEQLTVKDNDAADSAKSKSDEAAPAMEDAAKKTETAVKDTEQKKDETMETKADTDTKSTDTHADPAAEVPKEPAKPDFKDTSAYRRLLDLKDTPAYRRLVASLSAKERSPIIPKPHFPEAPYRRTYASLSAEEKPPIIPKPHFPEAPYRRTYASMSAKEQPPIVPKPHFPEAPYRRTYDYRKYDDTPILPKSYFPNRRTFGMSHPYRPPLVPPESRSFSDDFDVNRRRLLPNSDPIESLRELSSAGHADFDGYRRGFLSNTDAHESTRRLPSDITKTERTSISSGSWVRGSEPVKVPERIPAPFNPDTDVRSHNDVHMQLNDKDTEDLIHGKDGLTDAEKRKRYLMELLAEKIKSKVAEAQKRGLKVPDKIMDFLWDYESRRSTVPETDKTHFSH